MNEPDEYRPPVLDVDDEELPEPFWTPWRILYAIVAILVIIAFLTMVLWPLLHLLTTPPPPPPPPAQPLPRV
jgi:hypothetical protein